MTENELSKIIVDLCIKVHKGTGPGLLESVYEECLAYEFEKINIPFERQKVIPIVYDGQILGNGFRADFVIDNKVIIELKAVSELEPVHSAQLLTYLKLSNLKLGLLVNFGEKYVINGIKRIVNGL